MTLTHAEAAGATPRTPAPSVPAEVKAATLRGGSPLDHATCAWATGYLGHDFGDVRVHSDAASTRALGATAFTVGNRIVFEPGRYAPTTAAGRRLLVHELIHVQQQRGLSANPALVGAVDSAAEREAERAADLIDTGRPLGGRRHTVHARTVQRHPGPSCPRPPEWVPVGAGSREVYGPANRMIEEAYAAAHRGHRNQILVGSDFLYGGKPEWGITLPRGAPETEYARRFLGGFRGLARQKAPDIMDFAERTIYEIKTVNYAREGLDQLTRDYELAHTLTVDLGGRPFNRVNAVWFPPHILIPLSGNPNRLVCTASTLHVPGSEGLILYQVFERAGTPENEKKQQAAEQAVPTGVPTLTELDPALAPHQVLVRTGLARTHASAPLGTDLVIIMPQDAYLAVRRALTERTLDLMRVHGLEAQRSPVLGFHNLMLTVVGLYAAGLAAVSFVGYVSAPAEALTAGVTGAAGAGAVAEVIPLFALGARAAEPTAKAAGVLLVVWIGGRSNAAAAFETRQVLPLIAVPATELTLGKAAVVRLGDLVPRSGARWYVVGRARVAAAHAK